MRPSKDAYFLRIATIAAQMSTCDRRSVGCVLVDEREQILAVGFNGVPSGVPHCNEGNPCPGSNSPSGTNLSNCFAVHAEVNAVIQCRDPHSIETVYTTTAPCCDCTKFLMNTSAKRIVFIDAYPHTESERLWKSVARSWEHRPEGAGGHWDLEPAYPVPMMTGTRAHHESCPKCHGQGFVRVIDQDTAATDKLPETIGVVKLAKSSRDHGQFRKHCDCLFKYPQHLSEGRVVCDSCGLPLLFDENVAEKLAALRAEREKCVGGGHLGRLKASIIDRQIKGIEMKEEDQ